MRPQALQTPTRQKGLSRPCRGRAPSLRRPNLFGFCNALVHAGRALRRDRDFQNPVTLMREELVGLLDLRERKAMGHQSGEVDPARCHHL